MPVGELTVPVVTGLPLLVTVAVKVTFVPVGDGFSEETTAVVVATAASSVVIVRLHPPPIEPVSPEASSTTNRLQVPLGLVPVKAPASGVGPSRVPVPATATSRRAPLFVGLKVGVPG